MRFFIEFAYNGTNYHGWQKQPNAASVQEVLTFAVNTILKSSTELVGAGRTDTGVHAKQMMAHFDSDFEFDAEKLAFQLNSFLPDDIVVFKIFAVSQTAHARFDAKKRTYEYLIHTKKNPFENQRSYFFSQNLNLILMNQACEILKKHSDFECFSKVKTDVSTFNCKIELAQWSQTDHNLKFTITADRFLRNMVRAIVGTLINVGLEKVSLSGFQEIINSKDRKKAGFSVPAHGLYLTKIEYDF